MIKWFLIQRRYYHACFELPPERIFESKVKMIRENSIKFPPHFDWIYACAIYVGDVDVCMYDVCGLHYSLSVLILRKSLSSTPSKNIDLKLSDIWRNEASRQKNTTTTKQWTKFIVEKESLWHL